MRIHRWAAAAAVLTILAASLMIGSGGVAADRAPKARVQAPGVVVRRDVPYREANGAVLKLDAYYPDGAGPYPGVVLIHGGGWISGDKAGWEPFGRTLAQSGFAAFAVNYRLAPKDPYPAAVNDVRASVEWLRGHAADFRLDPARIGALGGSAGGHLAGLLATLGEGRRDSGGRVWTAVSWAGPMDLHPAQYPPDAQTYVNAFLDCRTGSCDESRVQEASPITHVDPSDATMLLSHGVEDQFVPLDQSRGMAAALDRAGVANQLLVVPSAGHDDRLAPTVVQPSIDFLRAQFFGPASPAVVAAPPPITASAPLPPLPALPPPTRFTNRAASPSTTAVGQAQSPAALRTGSGSDLLPWIAGFIGALVLAAALLAAAH